MIRELLNDIRNNEGTIKQIFILTHNVYFHKEVSYKPKRDTSKKISIESFWLIKKQDADSFIEEKKLNPIKTSYELLWMELRSKRRNNTTIRNTLRRILENYFTLLGGINLDTLYTSFKGDEKIICKALCSWLHDGSHNVFNDEHYIVLDDTSVERYIGVFKQIFMYSGQIAHYNMMMGKKLNESTKEIKNSNQNHNKQVKTNINSNKEGSLFDEL